MTSSALLAKDSNVKVTALLVIGSILLLSVPAAFDRTAWQSEAKRRARQHLAARKANGALHGRSRPSPHAAVAPA